MRLKHISTAKGSSDHTNGKHRRQNLSQHGKIFTGEPYSQIIHRAAISHSLSIYFPVHDAHRSLSYFGRHSQKSNQYHPYCRSGTSERNSDRYSGDVTQSNRSRKSSSQGLQMSQYTINLSIIIFHPRNALFLVFRFYPTIAIGRGD